MKRGFWALAALVLAIGPALPARAADDGFAAFWKTFAAAAGKDDRTALAAMTTLGTAIDDNDTPLTFAKVHAVLFKPAERQCLAKAKPQSQDDGTGVITYYVLCGQIIYGFSKPGGVWRFTDSSPDD